MKWLVLSPFFVANKVEKQILLSKAKLKLLSNEQQPSKMSASHIRIWTILQNKINSKEYR